MWDEIQLYGGNSTGTLPVPIGIEWHKSVRNYDNDVGIGGRRKEIL